MDTTTGTMKDFCIRQLGVVRREIGIIQPTHIVCYTHTFYDDWLPDVFDRMTCLHSENRLVGRKHMPWAEYVCDLDGAEIRLLRIGHPERMKREDYVSAVVDWINRN